MSFLSAISTLENRFYDDPLRTTQTTPVGVITPKFGNPSLLRLKKSTEKRGGGGGKRGKKQNKTKEKRWKRTQNRRRRPWWPAVRCRPAGTIRVCRCAGFRRSSSLGCVRLHFSKRSKKSIIALKMCNHQSTLATSPDPQSLTGEWFFSLFFFIRPSLTSKSDRFFGEQNDEVALEEAHLVLAAGQVGVEGAHRPPGARRRSAGAAQRLGPHARAAVALAFQIKTHIFQSWKRAHHSIQSPPIRSVTQTTHSTATQSPLYLFTMLAPSTDDFLHYTQERKDRQLSGSLQKWYFSNSWMGYSNRSLRINWIIFSRYKGCKTESHLTTTQSHLWLFTILAPPTDQFLHYTQERKARKLTVYYENFCVRIVEWVRIIGQWEGNWMIFSRYKGKQQPSRSYDCLPY